MINIPTADAIALNFSLIFSVRDQTIDVATIDAKVCTERVLYIRFYGLSCGLQWQQSTTWNESFNN
jgi:hypothetical protein